MIVISRITLNLRLVVYGEASVDEHTLLTWKVRSIHSNERSIEVRTTVDTEVFSAM